MNASTCKKRSNRRDRREHKEGQTFRKIRSGGLFRSAVAGIGGQANWTCRIETSADLVNWTLLREVLSAGAVTEFRDSETVNQTRRFDRVVKP